MSLHTTSDRRVELSAAAMPWCLIESGRAFTLFKKCSAAPNLLTRASFMYIVCRTFGFLVVRDLGIVLLARLSLHLGNKSRRRSPRPPRFPRSAMWGAQRSPHPGFAPARTEQDRPWLLLEVAPCPRNRSDPQVEKSFFGWLRPKKTAFGLG